MGVSMDATNRGVGAGSFFVVVVEPSWWVVAMVVVLVRWHTDEKDKHVTQVEQTRL
jgi:hypothetical protein